jgi:hypothetical protein
MLQLIDSCLSFYSKIPLNISSANDFQLFFFIHLCDIELTALLLQYGDKKEYNGLRLIEDKIVKKI